MGVEMKKVEVVKVPGQPLGIRGVELPCKAGILVIGTTKDSAAEVLEKGQRIVAVNGTVITGMANMVDAIMRPPPDKAVMVVVNITKEAEGSEVEVGLEGEEFELGDDLYVVEGGGDKLRIWDYILSVDEQPVESKEEIVAALEKHNHQVKMTVWRGTLTHLEHLFEREEGFDYFEIESKSSKFTQFTDMEMIGRRLFLTKVTPKTPSLRKLLPLDRILLINYNPFTSIEEAREQLTGGGPKVKLLIERPLEIKAHETLLAIVKETQTGKEPQAPWPDFDPASDIQSILRAAREGRETNLAANKGLLKQSRPKNLPKPEKSMHCILKSCHDSVAIHRDVSVDKLLKHVEKRS